MKRKQMKNNQDILGKQQDEAKIKSSDNESSIS